MNGYTYSFLPATENRCGVLMVTAPHVGWNNRPIAYVEMVTGGICDFDFSRDNFTDFGIIREIYWGAVDDIGVTFDTFDYDDNAKDITITVDGADMLIRLIEQTVLSYNFLK